MKRGVMKIATWYALLTLIVALAVLPILKAMAPQIFPENRREYFNGGAPSAAPVASCENTPCPEGQFCSDQKRCEPRYIGGTVPDGNE
jgi:hypothetical protein